MIKCENDDVLNTAMDVKTVNELIEDYNFTGQRPATITKKGDYAVTKTIKFFEAEGPFGFNYNVDGCSPAPFLTVSGLGNASHLGFYKIINQGCYDGVSPILGIITAANGDEIHTYIASAEQDLGTGIWTYHYKIYNGTGRFENATGDIYLMGTLDFVNWRWKLAGEGTITY